MGGLSMGTESFIALLLLEPSVLRFPHCVVTSLCLWKYSQGAEEGHLSPFFALTLTRNFVDYSTSLSWKSCLPGFQCLSQELLTTPFYSTSTPYLYEWERAVETVFEFPLHIILRSLASLSGESSWRPMTTFQGSSTWEAELSVSVAAALSLFVLVWRGKGALSPTLGLVLGSSAMVLPFTLPFCADQNSQPFYFIFCTL